MRITYNPLSYWTSYWIIPTESLNHLTHDFVTPHSRIVWEDRTTSPGLEQTGIKNVRNKKPFNLGQFGLVGNVHLMPGDWKKQSFSALWYTCVDIAVGSYQFIAMANLADIYIEIETF